MDLINSGFLFGEVFFLLLGLLRLLNARDSRAISLSLNVFLCVWQAFGISFYWHLGQTVSAAASVTVLIVLIVYTWFVFHFRKGSQ